MFRLFKEVFKSLSKNKIIMIGLALLVFLSSGVFTLLSSVRNNYTSQFQKYKDQSVLQDATVDLSVNLLGNAENNGFDEENVDNPEARTYYPKDAATEIVESFVIPKNKEYISLAELGINQPNAQNVFIKSNDLFLEYTRNSNFNNDNYKSTIFDLANANFRPNLTDGISFDTYLKGHSGGYINKKYQVSLAPGEIVKLDRNYSLGDVARVNKGSISLNLQNEDDYLTQIQPLSINVITKEATFNGAKASAWEKEGSLYIIKPQDLAPLMGFSKNNPEFPDRYYLDIAKASNKTLFWTLTSKEQNDNSVWSKNQIGKIKLFDSATIVSKTINNLGLTTTITKEVNDSFNFKYNTTYIFSKNWAKKVARTEFFVEHKYHLNFDPTKNNWTGLFRKYIENLKENDPAQFAKFQTFSYWEKKVALKNLSDNSVTETKQALKLSDLTKQIALKNSTNYTTIQRLEKLTNTQVESLDVLEELKNDKIKDQKFSEITKQASILAKNEIIEEVLKPKYGVEKIGIRQTITTKAFKNTTDVSGSDSPDASIVYHFINAGNENSEILGVKQQVGKLFEEQQTSAKSKLFIEGVDIDFSFIEPIYAAKIIEQIFNNFEPNKKYFIPATQYANYLYYLPNSNLPEKLNLQKILLLADKNEAPTQYAVAFKDNRYLILKKIIYSTEKSVDAAQWEVYTFTNKNSSEKLTELTLAQLDKFLLENQYTIAGKIPDSWLQKEGNRLFLPMEYVVPKASIVNDISENNNLSSLFQNILDYWVNSSIVKEGFFKEEDLIKIFNGFQKILEANNFQAVFSTGKIIPAEVQRMLLQAFDHLNRENGENFMNNVFSNFLRNIERKINFRKTASGTEIERTEEGKRQYFKEQINSLLNLLKNTMQLDFSNFLGAGFSFDQIINYVTRPSQFVKGLEKIFASIDTNKFFLLINNWYQEKWEKQDINQNYYSLSLAEILVFGLSSVRSEDFKNGLTDIVKSIDFNKMLNPELENSLADLLTKNSNAKDEKNVKNLFRKLNGALPGQDPYVNVTENFANIISLMDVNELADSLTKSLEDITFQDKKTTELGLTKEVTFTSRVIKQRNLIASIIKSFVSNPESGNFNKIQDFLVKLLNLSGKVSNALLFTIPAEDNDKVDLGSLTSLLSLGAKKEGGLEFDVDALIEKLNNNVYLTFADKNFILTNIPSNISLTAQNYAQQMVEWLTAYKQAYAKVKPWAYLNNLTSNEFLSNAINEDRRSQKTLGDFLQEFKNNSENTKKPILNIFKSVVESQFGKDNSVAANVEGVINTLGVWFDFAAQHPELSAYEISEVLSGLFNLLNQNSALYNYLNDEKLTTNMFSVNILQNSQTEDLKVTRGEVLINDIASELWNLNDNNALKSELLIAAQQQLRNYLNQNSATQKLARWLQTNRQFASYYLGLVASAIHNGNKFDELNNQFINYAFKNGNTAFNQKEVAILAQKAKKSLNLFSIFSLLGISPLITNTTLAPSYPQVLMWTVVDPNNSNVEGAGNLAFIFKNRITDFSNLTHGEISDLLLPLFSDELLDRSSISKEEENLVLNLGWLNWVKENYFDLANGQSLSLFDLNLTELLFGTVSSILDYAQNNSLIVLNDTRSYLTKVNHSFADKNNKTPYTGAIPNNPLEIENLLKTVDQSHVLDISGVKFLIVGFDSVVDYIYPVIDEENIQVDTQNQALVFVNQQGFDRATSSFRENAVKDYLLVKLQNSEKAQEFVSAINNYSSENFSSNINKRAYLTTELDPLNPERTLRISVVDGIISTISNFNLWIMIILGLLISLSVLFVTKRYISSRGKVLGILIAQGYSALEIGLSLTLFALFATGIGATIGYIAGIFLQQNLMNVFSSYWTIPTPTMEFSWWQLIMTIVVPFILLSLIIILTSLWVLRNKPTQLMSGLADLSVGRIAQIVARPFSKTGIKTKFVAALGINSFWKLIALMMSTILTSFAMIFSIASNKVLDRSINKTYEHRNYNYKISLTTPTDEGGGYETYNKNVLQNMLYVPTGTLAESEYYKGNYFKPGWAAINGNPDSTKLLNGNPGKYDPHIITKSSVDILIARAGIKISPWTIVLNSMPESQKARVLKLSAAAVKQMVLSQGVTEENGEYVLKENGQYKDFFDYDLENDKFVFKRWDNQALSYAAATINSDKYRNEYREFLINSYKAIPINDFFVAFGGVLFNEATNEKFSYAEAKFDKRNISIDGYSSKNKYIGIFADDQNLMQALEEFKIENEIYPLVINQVVAKKYNIEIGQILDLEITNKLSRYIDKVKNTVVNNNVKFQVIGINNTYINEEYITTQSIVNQITGIDKLPENQRFNGILSKDQTPTQLIESVGLYAPSGMWISGESINANTNSADSNAKFFEEIFANDGVMAKNGISQNQIRAFLNLDPEISLNRIDMRNADYIAKYSAAIRDALIRYTDVYSSSTYVPIAFSTLSKNIEANFIGSISDTINTISWALITIFFIISMIILVMISSMMIAENERNIAIFSILGYTTREKLILFFSIYTPIVILATLLATPLVIGFIAIFNSFLITTSSIVVPLVVAWWHVLVAILIILVIFAVTSIGSWISLNKIKAVHLLKGK
ncbi:FtsX-like permease family protein [Candidatus Mycoplasma pogonae]